MTTLMSGIICRRSGSNGLGRARAAALARAIAVPEQHRAAERLQLPLDLPVVASPCPCPRLDAEVRLEAMVRQKWPGGCGTAHLPGMLKEHNGERQSHRVSALNSPTDTEHQGDVSPRERVGGGARARSLKERARNS